MPNVEYGGTGFYYDKSPKLPYEVEHHMPDYHLYDEWVERQLSKGGKRSDFVYYLDYSIGFITRGCFRQCEFCVNKNYKRVEMHSPRLDERILTDEKCEVLFKSKYDGDYIFAFDNIADYEIIERKLQLLRKYTDKVPKFYLFCGFDRKDKWNDNFWKQDIFDIFVRIELLMKYRCLPYIMRFNRYEESPHRGMYVNLARWCNQPSFFKKKSFREFCLANGESSACYRYMNEFEHKFPDIKRYLDLKFEVLSK